MKSFPGGEAREYGWTPNLIQRRGLRKSRDVPLLTLWDFMDSNKVNYTELYILSDVTKNYSYDWHGPTSYDLHGHN